VSIQAGIWNFDGEPADKQFLERVSQATAKHGPDGETFHLNDSLGMLYRPFHTTKESCLERQPYVSPRNNVFTWDGRLDNREELIPKLDGCLAGDLTDVAIVAAAFDKWGTECFAKLLGDWALAIWNPCERGLILAKDFMGIRHLYYQQTPERIFWCTMLEPIVLLAENPWQVNGEFVAGYIASYPPAHVTPYVGVDAVPPCTYITIKRGKRKIKRYWHFDPSKKTRYRADSEYEEHFRQVFQEAIRSRLRSHTPVMAELSGGMDSSSIVCMADVIIADGKAETPRLDTMSYYDDEEPNWNEKPYFQKVEEKRGRRGTHICIVPKGPFVILPESYFVATPGMDQSSLHFETEQEVHLRGQGNRVVLSGIGGDEVLGGVPTAMPELTDLLRQFRLVEFTSKLKAWSLIQKRPWMHMLIHSFWNLARSGRRNRDLSSKLRRIPWLDSTFLNIYGKSSSDSDTFRVPGCSPSQRAFMRLLSHVSDQLALNSPALVAVQEMRYPYLDRPLCEFLLSVPREQVLRPTQRRSLMRRALVGIVPSEILERKRKAFTVRRFMTMYEEAWPTLQDRFHNSLSQQFHYVEENKFLQTLATTIHGHLSNLVQLNRSITLELWLRTLVAQERILHPTVIEEEIESRQIVNAVGISSGT
jgi:asparagine synthase (glutamine-hydrolysing)